MNWFFFGSMMDQEVLEIVVGRTVLEEEMITTILPGYRRVGVANESYPALVHTSNQSIEGVLIEDLDASESLRIIYFEGEEYKPEEVQLQLKNHKPESAYCFLASADLELVDREWDFESWRTQHLQDFLHLSEEWMASYGKLEFDEVNAQWLDSNKRRDWDN